MKNGLDPLHKPKAHLSIIGGLVVIGLLVVLLPKVFLAFAEKSSPLSRFTWDLNGFASIQGTIIGFFFVFAGSAIVLAIVISSWRYAKSTRPLEQQLAEVEADVQPDIPDQNGRTPLMIATSQHDFKGVLSLIKGGADVNARDRIGRTVLSYAKKISPKGRVISFHDIINVLIKAGARE